MGPAVPGRDGPEWGPRPHPHALRSDPSSWCRGFPCWPLLTVFLHAEVLSLGQKACPPRAKCSGSDQKGREGKTEQLFQAFPADPQLHSEHPSSRSRRALTPAMSLPVGRGPRPGTWTACTQWEHLVSGNHREATPCKAHALGGSRCEATGRGLHLPDSIITSLPLSSRLSEDQPSSPQGQEEDGGPALPASSPSLSVGPARSRHLAAAAVLTCNSHRSRGMGWSPVGR